MSKKAARWLGGLAIAGPMLVLSAACSGGYILNLLFWLGVDIANQGPVAVHESDSPLKSAVTRSMDRTYLGAAAHLTGAADTNWRSDVELHNASNEIAVVTLELLEHGEGNTSPEWAEFYLGPRRSVRLADVLAASFGDADKAALRVSTNGGAILATDRTYNLLGQGNALGLPAGATFGQYIPLRGAESALGDAVEGRLIGLTHGDRARTNLGLVNLSPFETRVKTEVYLADGTVLGSFSVRLAPFEYRQITRIFERATAAPVADGYLVVKGLTEGGRFHAHASVVDAVTGDPVFVPAQPMAWPEGQPPPSVFIVAAAHVTGAAGTNWRTDLEIHNPGSATLDYTVELLEINSNNSSPRTATGTLEPDTCTRHEDALVDLFGFDGAAALKIVPDGGRVVVSSRTYNLLEAGNPYGLPEGASFGQFIPGVDLTTAVTPDSEGRMIHLSHDPSGTQGFRTNLVLVNGTSDRAPLVVELFSADATPLGTLEYNLRAFEYKQINNVIARVTEGAVENGYAVVRMTGSEGAVFALASVVDNLTGDPVGMMATTVRTATAAGAVNTTDALMGILGGVILEYPVSIEDLVESAGGVGPDGLADIAVNAYPPGTATRQGDVVTADFGAGFLVEGVTLTGSMTLDLSGLVADGTGIRGEIVETYDGFEVNGVPPDLEALRITVNLVVQPDDTVAGTVELSGGSVSKSTGATLEGSVGIDTGICLNYPISGSVTFNSSEGEAVTITFGPDCDGTFGVDVDPAWDWEHRFQSPITDWAKTYVVEAINAHVTKDVAEYWIPSTGGTEFYGRNNPGDTPAGIITYRFPFANSTVAARIRTDTATFSFETSRGHNYLLASANGIDWEVINEVPPPDSLGDPPRSGYYDGILPASVMGSNELWIRVELYAYGTGAVGGFTNTAQHARYWESGARDTFILEVACANGICLQ